jgi:hypothetical protein
MSLWVHLHTYIYVHIHICTYVHIYKQHQYVPLGSIIHSKMLRQDFTHTHVYIHIYEHTYQQVPGVPSFPARYSLLLCHSAWWLRPVSPLRPPKNTTELLSRIYTYIYIYMYMYIYIYIFWNKNCHYGCFHYTFTHAHMCVYTYIHIHTCVYIYSFMYALCLYTYT